MVQWEAWAVGFAIVSIAATLFLGFMTLRLGRAANKASATAVDLAARDAGIRERRDHEEQLILLMRLAGEMSDAQTQLERIRSKVVLEDGECEFLDSQSVREEVVAHWRGVRFPNYEACSDRLHYLPLDVAARMARVVGLVGSFVSGIENEDAPTEGQAKTAQIGFEFLTRILLADLEVVQVACGNAVAELNLVDQEIVAEAERIKALDF
ncbi:hypothetical protein A7X93_17970 [Stenotrophomonas maltophilia]|nr:hypothetical protein A7X93_17970 [Stenotrophomonas maltophilia]